MAWNLPSSEAASRPILLALLITVPVVLGASAFGAVDTGVETALDPDATPHVADPGVPVPPPGGGLNDPWIDASGDVMFGDLELGENALRLAGGRLTYEAGFLSWNGAPVCVANAPIDECFATGVMSITPGLGILVEDATRQLPTVHVDASVFQTRIQGPCAPGEAVQDVDIGGSLTCVPIPPPFTPRGKIELTTDGYLQLKHCAAGELLTMNEWGGAWECGTVDSGAATGPGAGAGLQLVDGNLSLVDCDEEQVVWSLAPGAWACQGALRDVAGGLSATGATVSLMDCAAGEILESAGPRVWSCGRNELGPEEVQGWNVAPAAIQQHHLTVAAVGAENIEGGAVGSAQLALGSVLHHHVAANAITGDAIMTGAIEGHHITPGTITGDLIAPGASIEPTAIVGTAATLTGDQQFNDGLLSIVASTGVVRIGTSDQPAPLRVEGTVAADAYELLEPIPRKAIVGAPAFTLAASDGLEPVHRSDRLYIRDNLPSDENPTVHVVAPVELPLTANVVGFGCTTMDDSADWDVRLTARFNETDLMTGVETPRGMVNGLTSGAAALPAVRSTTFAGFSPGDTDHFFLEVRMELVPAHPDAVWPADPSSMALVGCFVDYNLYGL